MTTLEIYGGPLGMDHGPRRFIYAVKSDGDAEEAIGFLKRNGYMEMSASGRDGVTVYVFHYDNENWPRLFNATIND